MFHVVYITTHTHDRLKLNGKNKGKKKRREEKRREKKRKKRRGKKKRKEKKRKEKKRKEKKKRKQGKERKRYHISRPQELTKYSIDFIEGVKCINGTEGRTQQGEDKCINGTGGGTQQGEEVRAALS